MSFRHWPTAETSVKLIDWLREQKRRKFDLTLIFDREVRSHNSTVHVDVKIQYNAYCIIRRDGPEGFFILAFSCGDDDRRRRRRRKVTKPSTSCHKYRISHQSNCITCITVPCLFIFRRRKKILFSPRSSFASIEKRAVTVTHPESRTAFGCSEPIRIFAKRHVRNSIRFGSRRKKIIETPKEGEGGLVPCTCFT